MASKNMFEVLRRDESDDEEKPKKDTKHVQRADDKQKREATGDRVEKQNYHSKNTDARPAKDKFAGDGKRTYERHSGTGENTFNKAEKKAGGGGKGNWGNDQDQIANEVGGNKEGAEKKEGQNDQPEEQAEPVLTLDNYMKENQINLEFQYRGDVSTGIQTTTAEKGFKVLKATERDFVEAAVKNKNMDNIAKSKSHQIEGIESAGGYKGKGHQGKGGKQMKAKD